MKLNRNEILAALLLGAAMGAILVLVIFWKDLGIIP